MLLEATPAQLLAGLPVGTQASTHCQWCDHEFYEGDVATVLVFRPAGTDHWEIYRAYCAACDPTAITTSTLGCTELLAQCRLGTQADFATQQTELVALEPELIDSSEPAESQSTVETDSETSPTKTQSAPSTGDDSVSADTVLLSTHLNVPASHRYPLAGDTHEPTSGRLEERPAQHGTT